MTYDDRIRIVSGWLATFLGRFSPPDRLTDDAMKQEMVEIAETVNSRLPSHLNAEQVKQRLADIGRQVALKHKTRAWPLLSEFAEAMYRAGKAQTGNSEDVENFMLERCEDWHSKFNEPMPSCVNEDRALRLLKRGRCGDASEMRRAGYPLPQSV